MKCINIYRQEYIKCYNHIIDITEMVKEFLYPGKYYFSRIDSTFSIKKQLYLIKEDLESITFESEVHEEFVKSLEEYFPINESELENKDLDTLQLYFNPLLSSLKNKLKTKYLPLIKKVEIMDFKDASYEVYDNDEKAWRDFLKDKDSVDKVQRLIDKIIYRFYSEAKDEEVDEFLKSFYQLDEIQFNRYSRRGDHKYSSIRTTKESEEKLMVNFKQFDRIFEDIFGQDLAIDKIRKTLLRTILFYNAEDLKKGKSKTKNRGPLATFMFYGPTGTGKTEAAKKMAKFVYGSESKMLLLDMNSYKDPRVSASAIKGHPEGYVDSAKGTDFTRFLANNNKGIIVLDEFEKASDEVRELFMTMLDEGRFKDALGNVYDLSGYIFVATTNVSKVFENQSRRIGFGNFDEGQASKDEDLRIRDELRSIFTAPILNRFNNIIGFKEISKKDASLICKDLIKKLVSKLESKNFNGVLANIEIENVDEVVEVILIESNFKKDGVRSLKNVINDIVGTPILEQIVLKNGKINISSSNGKIVVNGAKRSNSTMKRN